MNIHMVVSDTRRDVLAGQGGTNNQLSVSPTFVSIYQRQDADRFPDRV